MKHPCDDCRQNCKIPCWKVDYGLLIEPPYLTQLKEEEKEQEIENNSPVLRTTYETPEECPECLEHLSLDWAYCPSCGRPTDWNNSNH